MSYSEDMGPMRRALELAERAWGETHPNPMVGAVLVEKGVVVAEGWHRAAGEDHAEIVALKALGRKAEATLYVTLEPCSTRGRTEACTEAILASGLKRVVVGTMDPNPAHAGRGIKVLREAGIEVITGVEEQACRDLNLIFHHWMTRGRPLIAGKIATTLDGKVATRSGHSQWITGESARADVHRWRRLFPAILCGSGTALADDPALTVRMPGKAVHCPHRFILDRRLETLRKPKLQLFTDAYREKTTLVTSMGQSQERLAEAASLGVQVWAFPTDSQACFFDAFMERCVAMGIHGVYVEGGGKLLSALLADQMLDYLFAYRAPKFLADDQALTCFGGQCIDSLDAAFQLREDRGAVLGCDQLLRGFVEYGSSK